MSTTTLSIRFEDITQVQCQLFECPYHSKQCGKATASCELKSICLDGEGKCSNRPKEPAKKKQAKTQTVFGKAFEHFSKLP